MQLEDLDRRLRRLEAVDDIKKLRLRYARICDTGRDPDKLRTVFTEDALWDGGSETGVFRGIEEILARADVTRATFVWNLHYMLAPIIEVASSLEEATGTWYIWEPCNIVDGEERRSVVVMATYFDRYRLTAGEWRISELHFRTELVGPMPESWWRGDHFDTEVDSLVSIPAR